MNHTILGVIAILAAATLVIATLAAAAPAFAANNLNSSKSNIYRQSTNQNLSVNGGSGEQVSTNVCTCTSNDEITLNSNEG